MRHFEVRHKMRVPSDDFWKFVHYGKDFLQALYVDHLGFTFDLLKDDKETGERSTYITPKVVMPKAIKKVIGDSISFTETGTLHREASGNRYEFKVVPNKLADKIFITGNMTTPKLGDNECERVVAFNINCKIFGVGGIVERFIQMEVERSYNDSAKFTADYLKTCVS